MAIHRDDYLRCHASWPAARHCKRRKVSIKFGRDSGIAGRRSKLKRVREAGAGGGIIRSQLNQPAGVKLGCKPIANSLTQDHAAAVPERRGLRGWRISRLKPGRDLCPGSIALSSA